MVEEVVFLRLYNINKQLSYEKKNLTWKQSYYGNGTKQDYCACVLLDAIV